MNRTQVITISSRVPHEAYYFFKQFQASCARVGITPHYLNEGQYRGLMSKPKFLKAYLDREGSSFDHVLVVDAWDILLITSIEEILYNYKGFGRPVVFNAERNCFPRGDLAPQFDALAPNINGVLSPYRYLNSGFFVGETDAVRQMLNEMNLSEIPDDTRNADGSWLCHNDQETYGLWFLRDTAREKPIAALDYFGILCQTLHGSEPAEFAYRPDTKRVVSLLTGNQPCAVHGNGGGKEWLQKMITWMGL